MSMQISHLSDEAYVLFPYRIRARTVEIRINLDELKEIAEYYEDVQGGSKMNEMFFKGTNLYVKLINKRSGGVAYGLFRYFSKSALDEFRDLDKANFIASYIDSHGGSYGSDQRKAAKLAWLWRFTP